MAFEQVRDPKSTTRWIQSLLVPSFCWVALASPAAAERICMVPAQLPFAKDDDRRQSLEALITRQLEAESFEVVASAEVGATLEQIDARSGAIYDPLDGRIDEHLESLFLDDTEATLRDALGCTRLLTTGLHQVMAWYDGTHAIWDGQKTRVNSAARIATRLFTSAVIGAYISEHGWVPALSLWIRVTDLRGQNEFYRTAGVEPLMDFSYSRDQDLLPEDRWLRDGEVLAAAVESAIGFELYRLDSGRTPAAAPGGSGIEPE